MSARLDARLRPVCAYAASAERSRGTLWAPLSHLRVNGRGLPIAIAWKEDGVLDACCFTSAGVLPERGFIYWRRGGAGLGVYAGEWLSLALAVSSVFLYGPGGCNQTLKSFAALIFLLMYVRDSWNEVHMYFS